MRKCGGTAKVEFDVADVDVEVDDADDVEADLRLSAGEGS